jgi:hypothetical protein
MVTIHRLITKRTKGTYITNKERIESVNGSGDSERLYRLCDMSYVMFKFYHP